MGYNIENGGTLPGKRKKKFLLELEKEKSKQLKSFKKLLKLINQSHLYNKSRQS